VSKEFKKYTQSEPYQRNGRTYVMVDVDPFTSIERDITPQPEETPRVENAQAIARPRDGAVRL